ncbi:MAG: hypothetical protein ACNS62_12845 [Candidatus Cyclobacteriaceae bacterium M3_2C_046]
MKQLVLNMIMMALIGHIYLPDKPDQPTKVNDPSVKISVDFKDEDDQIAKKADQNEMKKAEKMNGSKVRPDKENERNGRWNSREEQRNHARERSKGRAFANKPVSIPE